MRYQLNREQYIALWDKHENCRGVTASTEKRYHIWYTIYKKKFRLEYSEILFERFIDASIVGKEKDITWFLLQL